MKKILTILKNLKKQKGFTLVELMISISILGIVSIIVLEMFIQTNRFIIEVDAKNSMLYQQYYLQKRLIPLTYGAYNVFDPYHIENGSLEDWPHNVYLENIEFATSVKQQGQMKYYWVMLNNEKTGDYYIDSNGNCVPRTYTTLHLKRVNEYETYNPPTIDDWNNWTDVTKIQLFPRSGISRNTGYSNIGIYYTFNKLSPVNDINVKWSIAYLTVTIGITKHIYSDSNCKIVKYSFPYDLQPYTVVIPISFTKSFK